MKTCACQEHERTGRTSQVTYLIENAHLGPVLCATMADEHTMVTGGQADGVCAHFPAEHVGCATAVDTAWRQVVNVWALGRRPDANRALKASSVQHKLLRAMYGHTAPVSCLATSRAYSIIVSGSDVW